MTDRELMQQALENCRLLAARHRKEEWAQHILRFCEEAGVRPTALRARLAQPEQKHSEAWWRHEVSNAFANGYEKGRASALKQPEQEPVAWGIANTRPTEKNPLMMVMLDKPEPSHLVVPLYTAPPPPKIYTDVGEMFKDMGIPEQPEQEPVFNRRWSLARDGFGLERDDKGGNYIHIDDALAVLHTAPPQREWQGLTDEEVWEIPSYDQTSRMYRFARAIEAKLKEKNGG